MLGLLTNSSSALTSLSSSTVCTDCNHGLVSALKPIENGTLSTPLSQTCGSSYADGVIPSSVSLKSNASSSASASRGAATPTGSASNASTTPQPTNGGSRLGAGAISAILLSVVAGAMTLA